MAVSGYESSLWILDTTADLSLKTSEPMTAQDTARTLYGVTDRTKRWWAPHVLVGVQVNGTPLDEGTYDVIFAGGFVRLHTPAPAGAVVTADFGYWPATNVSKLGKSREWTLDQKTSMKDVTNWDSDSGFDEFVPITSGATVSLARWWVDQLFFDRLQDEEKPLVALELRVDDDVAYYVYGQFAANSIKSAVNDIADENLQVQVSGGIGFIM